MLVRAGQEEDVLSVAALEARQRVGGNHRVGVADMRLAVRIEDRSRNVEFFAGHEKPLEMQVRMFEGR
jgi:hypothetical protein